MKELTDIKGLIKISKGEYAVDLISPEESIDGEKITILSDSM